MDCRLLKRIKILDQSRVLLYSVHIHDIHTYIQYMHTSIYIILYIFYAYIHDMSTVEICIL